MIISLKYTIGCYGYVEDRLDAFEQGGLAKWALVKYYPHMHVHTHTHTLTHTLTHTHTHTDTQKHTQEISGPGISQRERESGRDPSDSQ